MTVGVGGSTPAQALERLRNMMDGAQPIGLASYRARIAAAQAWMGEHGIAAAYLHAGSNLRYFSGVQWHPSERLVGALLPAEGALEYLAPAFEEGTVRDFQVVDGAIHTWEEHQDPYRLLLDRLEALGVGERSTVALCPSLPFGMFERLRQQAPGRNFVSAAPLIDQGRMRKSAEELALMQRAKDMTLEVQKAAASILREGISTTEVAEFIHQAHRKVGAPGSTFCIVLFGAASAFPHGVKHAQVLKDGDMVLIDTGCQVHGYQSDITRSYVFGTPSARQREFWGMERDAQLAAFEAARLGQPCEAVDAAAGCRHVLQQRTDDLRARRVRHSPGGSLLHDEGRTALVHPTEPVHRRSLRPRRLIRPNDNAARGKARTRASRVRRSDQSSFTREKSRADIGLMR
ncbi:M24 family metallopeptidase [Pseudomonas aeruginosa]|uniref:M24 family metallopeptidase n=1 Tax=Pseudomonas aeruginosa TaxID=287 RepID=UPI003F5CC3D0